MFVNARESYEHLVVTVFYDKDPVFASKLRFPGAAAVVVVSPKSTVRRNKDMYVDLFGLSLGASFLWCRCAARGRGPRDPCPMQPTTLSCPTRPFRCGATCLRAAGTFLPRGGATPSRAPAPAPPRRL